MTNEPAVIEAAARALVDWVRWHVRMVEVARRPWAVIGNEVVAQADVVFHDPDGIR